MKFELNPLWIMSADFKINMVVQTYYCLHLINSALINAKGFILKILRLQECTNMMLAESSLLLWILIGYLIFSQSMWIISCNMSLFCYLTWLTSKNVYRADSFSDYISKLIILIYIMQVLPCNVRAFTSSSLEVRSSTQISHSDARYDRDN